MLWFVLELVDLVQSLGVFIEEFVEIPMEKWMGKILPETKTAEKWVVTVALF